ncbi:MAG: hypothetical protein LBV79_11615, partial [Candidatus Adiutrix sp.]|nr:hypothetical protein [Candidatus Adiutrix sp.]
VFRQVRELRLKESDRLTGIKHQLGALGVEVRVENDDLIIKGPEEPHGMMPTRLGRVQTASCPNLEIKPERLDSDHDHRLAMTLHLALAAAGRDIPILGDESISVSYPAFKADLARLRSGKAEP